MAIELPDINLMLAILDQAHPNHIRGKAWFSSASVTGWATCPLTQNGFVRVLSTQSYPGIRMRTEDAVALLKTAVANHPLTHHFWEDSISIYDASLINPTRLRGPKQITDIYLLALCQKHRSTFVTFDQGITVEAIVSPHPNLLKTL